MNLDLPSLPSSITHRHQPKFDIVAWSNKKIPKNSLMAIAFTFGLIFSLTITGYFTYQIYITKLSDQTFLGKIGISFFYLLCWILLVGSFAVLRGLTWTECIKISNDYIIINSTGAFAPKAVRFTKQQVTALTFQRFHGGEQETLPSLNLVYKDSSLSIWVEKRVQLAFWMRRKEKHQLFLFLQAILQERGWKIKYRQNLN